MFCWGPVILFSPVSSVHVFLHGIQNSWTCPRTAWLPAVRGHVTEDAVGSLRKECLHSIHSLFSRVLS